MNKFQDYVCKYGLWHHKVCKNSAPRSNNGWIYTAYAKALGHVASSKEQLTYLFYRCESTHSDFYYDRLPGKQEPPISRDEIIGMISLGMPDVTHNLVSRGWLMCENSWNVSLFTLWDSVKELWAIRKEHRNFMWQEKRYAAYPIAFRIMWHDRHYITKKAQNKTSIFNYCMFQLYAFSTIIQKNISARNVLWLQLHDLNSVFWIKFLNQPKNFIKYFGPEHPFNR